MDEGSPEEQFDRWAASYDDAISDDTTFPFDGYGRVLQRVVDSAAIQGGMSLLELGPGSGNLTQKLVAAGATVWAIDFSAEMLAIARRKVPAATFAKAHLMADYPAGFQRPYDRIVSTYTFHELPLVEKMALLQKLATSYLRHDGKIVIGDIGFTDAAALDEVRLAAGPSWEDEYYWLRDETAAALRPIGLSLEWAQISSCGVVIIIKKAPGE